MRDKIRWGSEPMEDQTMLRMKILIAILTIVIAASIPTFSSESKEAKAGRELAAEFEKSAKLVSDPAVNDRVDRIGQALAAVAKTNECTADYGSSELADFDYHFKIIEDKDINAFSFSGGYVYVYKGLLDFSKTDDEIAGVLAHEVAHAAHHHMAALMRKQSRLDTYIALIALAGGLSKMRSQDLTNVIYGAQFIKTARLTGYGQQAEFDADRAAVIYARKAGYNPCGILQFLSRLTDYQESQGEIRNLGIFQTHPASVEREERIAEQVKGMGMDVDLRDIQHLAKAKAEPVNINGKELWQVVVADKPVCTIADAGGISSQERARQVSDSINAILRTGLAPTEVSTNAGRSEMACGGKVVLNITPADSAIKGEAASALLDQAAEAVRYALWSDWVRKQCVHY
jgi:hypothetical protein